MAWWTRTWLASHRGDAAGFRAADVRLACGNPGLEILRGFLETARLDVEPRHALDQRRLLCAAFGDVAHAPFGFFTRRLQAREHVPEPILGRALLRFVRHDGGRGLVAPALTRAAFFVGPPAFRRDDVEPPLHARQLVGGT